MARQGAQLAIVRRHGRYCRSGRAGIISASISLEGVGSTPATSRTVLQRRSCRPSPTAGSRTRQVSTSHRGSLIQPCSSIRPKSMCSGGASPVQRNKWRRARTRCFSSQVGLPQRIQRQPAVLRAQEALTAGRRSTFRSSTQIEYKVTSRKKAFLWLGDSISESATGVVGTSYPTTCRPCSIQDSYPARWARANGFL